MAEKLIARQTADGLWQWRIATDGQWQSDVYHTGDDEALADSIQNSGTQVTLLVAGQEVVSCNAKVDAKEKRHLAKLLPYELEEDVIDSIDNIHLGHVPLSDSEVAVTYCDNDFMETALAPLQALGCDLRVVLADYQTLKLENDGVTLVLDGHQLIVRTGRYAGFAVETSLAPLVLAGLDLEMDFTATVNLVAESEEHFELIQSWLPAQWTEENGPEIKTNLGGFWDWVEPGLSDVGINLRRGAFSRQLPVARWANLWRTPLIAAAAAYLLAVGVGFGEYLSAKSEQKRIVREMNDVYLAAVPNGRRGDPEGSLRAMVSGRDGSGAFEPTNLMVLIDGVADLIQQSGKIEVTSFRYNSDQKELLMNIVGDSFADLEGLRSNVTAKGFVAELLRVEAKGDKHSGRIKVAEASQ